MKRLYLGLLLLVPLASCELLDTMVTTDDGDGSFTTQPLGDELADNSDTIGNTVGATVTTVTGNPLFGLLAAGAASALAAAAATARRKKVYKGPGDVVPYGHTGEDII